MYYVYAIKSLKRNYIYVGLTKDITRRLNDHNKGYSKTTKPYRPFTLIYKSSFNNRSKARKKEKYLKSGIGKELLKNF